MPIHNTLTSKTINLPLIGTISLTAAIAGGVLLFFLLKRKRVTSITKTTRFGRR